ncbi:ATP-grasp ribosomal peptide maturase [Streptomyces carminius]|uniref:ATP-grasp ribosomal peptide maturase n=1 Tax=Streptomyces carminius TaxID=2665496 RepID=A0A2M8M1P5_9ACTN|nr:ATP-grasp ribosomal peptide maturase [Streptomyces carminius]PJE98128.1 ATP-grasp ribosomal peptide maturase [Streptomyces carminius]
MPAPRGHVLVVAEELDASADLVVQALTDRKVPVLRFDLADFPQHITLAAEHDDGTPGWRGELDTGARAARLEAVRAVYYRRPGPPRISPDVAEDYQAWAQAQALVGMTQLLSCLPVTWLHHPDIYRAAAHKPAQLTAATNAGLTVPRTLITNRLAHARRWAQRTGSPLVCKPIAIAPLTRPGQDPLMLPTRRVDPAELDESLETTAHLLQEWIPKAYEVRLTVVGQAMFPVAIHAHSDAAHIDWRADYDALTYEPVPIPDHVAQAVRRFMAHYRLNYGAFDFAVTPAGRWVFFECNPAGQWQFVATTKLPIAEAHADLLQGATT